MNPNYHRALVRADMGSALHLAKDVPGQAVRTMCGIEFTSELDTSAERLRASALCSGCFSAARRPPERPPVVATFAGSGGVGWSVYRRRSR